MEVPHVDIVREKLGKQALLALQALYFDAKGTPPSVPVERFRADHHQWFDVLDDLEHRHSLIERSRDGREYLIRSYALPLIEEAAALIEQMRQLYQRLRDLYPEHLSESLDLSVLIEGLGGKESEWLDALYYLMECTGVWSGKSNEFPYGEQRSVCISEGVLRKKTIGDVLSQYYEWHFINPSNTAAEWFTEIENDEPVSTFFSQELTGGFPLWYEELDDIKKSLIREIDIALNKNLSVLPMVGLRTLLDVVIVEKVGDAGTFGQKLSKFEKEGFTTKKDSELISSVLDAGNAAAHRAYFPNDEDLRTCVEVVKHLMEGVFILQPKVRQLKENTPNRGGKNND